MTKFNKNELIFILVNIKCVETVFIHIVFKNKFDNLF